MPIAYYLLSIIVYNSSIDRLYFHISSIDLFLQQTMRTYLGYLYRSKTIHRFSFNMYYYYSKTFSKCFQFHLLYAILVRYIWYDSYFTVGLNLAVTSHNTSVRMTFFHPVLYVVCRSIFHVVSKLVRIWPLNASKCYYILVMYYNYNNL